MVFLKNKEILMQNQLLNTFVDISKFYGCVFETKLFALSIYESRTLDYF